MLKSVGFSDAGLIFSLRVFTAATLTISVLGALSVRLELLVIFFFKRKEIWLSTRQFSRLRLNWQSISN